MKNRTILFSGVAFTLLSLGCSKASPPPADANKLSQEEQMLAVFPKMDPGTVLKVCNTSGQPGDRGSLQFSIMAAKPDPNNPGRTIPTDQPSLEQQLAAILPFVDGQHALNIRSVTDKASGQVHLVFTVEASKQEVNG
ncbi:MAG: hypothetical protein JST45_03390 [Bacteroidetes bacterium]|nr:hypothetical protein [Bacteroidota bacterium]